MHATTGHLELPFFDEAHRALGAGLSAWAPQQVVDESDDRPACRQWVRLLGDAGWLRYCVPAAYGGALERLDSRALVILRETLAFHSPLADFAFAMQGLGSGAITLAGTAAQQAAYLEPVARGDRIAAFALSEPDAGSDVAAMATSARTEPDGSVVLNGTKTWISNGGIADYYCVFAKTDPTAGTRGITAFLVDADNPGKEIIHRGKFKNLNPQQKAWLRRRQAVEPANTRFHLPSGDGSYGACLATATTALGI